VLKHQPGKANTKADALSRRADHSRGETDNERTTLLKDKLFVRIWEEGDELHKMENELRKVHPRMWEEKVKKAIENKEDGWIVREGGLVTWHERVYIHRSEE